MNTRRRSLVAATASVATGTVILLIFLLTDWLHRAPASTTAMVVLGLVSALCGGIGVFVAPLIATQLPIAQRLHRLVLTVVVAGAALLALNSAFVVPKIVGGARTSSVVAFRLPCNEGSRVDCEGRTLTQCLGDIGYQEEWIWDCWGRNRVLAVELALALSSLIVSAGLGGMMGLVLARRTDVEARPLRLFICYRRADTGAAVEVLAKRLSDRFGASNVFRDVEGIRLGADFRQAVRQALSGCDVFLLMIGPQWLDARAADGARRLDRPDDPVRIEIETAIARGLLIVPVLVGGAAMPRSDQMPDGFEELSNRAGAALHGDPAAPDDPAFATSVDALIRQLEQTQESEPASGEGGAGGPTGLLTVPREATTVLPRPLPETAGEQADIFVSHSRSDEAFATRLVAALRAAGASVFYAPESIRTSDSFVERINRAIGGCRLAVLLWSGAAERSSWVTMEINSLIVRRNRDRLRIQVVRLEPLEVPALLADIHRIDAFPSPDANEVAREILAGFGPATTPPADDLGPAAQ